MARDLDRRTAEAEWAHSLEKRVAESRMIALRIDCLEGFFWANDDSR